MIRSNVVLNEESLLFRIESYNQGFLTNNNLGILNLYGDVAKNMETIIASIGEDHHDRQTISLFAKNITKNFPLLAEEISHYINNYFFSIPEIATAVFSNLAQSNFLNTSRALVNLRYLSPYFNNIAFDVIKVWLNDQAEVVPLYELGLRTATETIEFVKTHNLTKIYLKYIIFTAEKFIEVAKNCPNITIVYSPLRVTDKGIIEFVKICQKLSEIKTCYFTDESLKQIAKSCSLLKQINLDSAHITDESVIKLAKRCTLLSAINLNCTDVTDKGLLEIAKFCPHLTKIDCQETAISTISASALIKNCLHLTEINLGYTQVNGNSIIELLKDRENLTKLRLSDTGVSKMSFEMIMKSFPTLNELFLSDYKITYEELVALATACPELKLYYFNIDNISEDDFSQFEADFPHCQYDG